MENTETQQFKQTVMSLVPAMEGVLRRMLCEEIDVRDALQETLLRLWRYRSQLVHALNAKAYCVGVVRNVALDMLKRQKMNTPLEDAAEIVAPDGNSDDLEAVYEALQHLTENQRRVIRLRGAEGLEVVEIAACMNLSEANVRQLLSRGRKRLRELLREKS